MSLQYTFVDEFGNDLEKSMKLKDHTPYVVLWHLPDGDNGLYVTTGKQLREWADIAEWYPGKVSGRCEGIGWFEFETIQDLFNHMSIRADVKLARQLQDLCSPFEVAVFSPEGISNWHTWKRDKEDAIDWRYKWETTFIKQTENGDYKTFSGKTIALHEDGAPTLEEMWDAEPDYRSYMEPDTDYDRIPWRATNYLDKDKVEYYCDLSTISWNTIKDGNVCNPLGHWEHHWGCVTYPQARQIMPTLDEGREVLGLRSIKWNNEIIWKDED